MADYDDDLNSTDPQLRARALIKRGIALVESGDHEAAMADLQQGEALAEQAGMTSAVIASRINQGYAHTQLGDPESAARLYGEAAELAREADDKPKLAMALGNLGVSLQALGRHDDALDALTEYVGLLGEENVEARASAYVTQAVSCIRLGEDSEAFSRLEQAEKLLAGGEDKALLYTAMSMRAGIYVRQEDDLASKMLLERTLEIAREVGDPAQLRETLSSLAQTCWRLGIVDMAARHYSELVAECRKASDPALLADALYWQGLALQPMRHTDEALAAWREEEAIRRDRGEDGHLAECLAAQADALRTTGEHEAADPIFEEAAELFAGLGMNGELADLLYWHGMSRRAADDSEKALAKADRALEVAEANDDVDVQRRAQGLRAMALADLGRTEEAHTALDAAELLCEQTTAKSALVWTFARRAYVLACAQAEPDEVVAQLRKAHRWAMDEAQFETSRGAVRKIAVDIISRCGESYAEAIDAFRRDQLKEIELALSGGMPRMPRSVSDETGDVEPEPDPLATEDPNEQIPEE